MNEIPKKTILARWLQPLIGPALVLGAGLLLIFFVGVAQRFGWMRANQESSSAEVAGASAEGGEYTCPMHPQIRQDGPGRCPLCGMPLEIAASAGHSITPAARRLAGIETVAAKPIALVKSIRAVGEIAYDESQLKTISAYVDGRVETLFGDYTGVTVHQGKDMARLFSPQLYAAQVEYLEATKRSSARSAGSSRMAKTRGQLAEAAKRNLHELGMTFAQIDELATHREAQTRITIQAPMEGTVIEKLVDEGQYVKAGQPIYRIANLATVWLLLELFPEDAGVIRYGQQVTAEVRSVPGETFSGRVAFKNPMVDPKTRTVKVRIVLDNDDGKLLPGDYATAVIEVPIGQSGAVYDDALAGKWISPRHPQVIADAPGDCPICGIELVPTSQFGFSPIPTPQQPALVVPRDAILKVGSESAVYVEAEPGEFEIRFIKLGPITAEHAVVLDGIEEGDQIATSGNFLIDSQMQLAGKPSLIDPDRAIAAQEKKRLATPLQLVSAEPLSFGDLVGERLEALYQAYLPVQKNLAADSMVNEDQAVALHTAASNLIGLTDLPDDLRELTQVIRERSEHLHHKVLDEARLDFKPISKSILLLASRARGKNATTSFIHYHCPMVKGGGGDWLQAEPPLLNPYWGSDMLHCGSEVRTLPPAKNIDAPRSKSEEDEEPSP